MTTNAPMRSAKEDKRCQRACQSKNPRMAHSSFMSREFSGNDVLFVVGRNLKTLKAAIKVMKVNKIKSLRQVSFREQLHSCSQQHSLQRPPKA